MCPFEICHVHARTAEGSLLPPARNGKGPEFNLILRPTQIFLPPSRFGELEGITILLLRSPRNCARHLHNR